MKVKSESEVAQSCPTLSDLILPGSSIHGIFQARVLEWCHSAKEQMKNLGLWDSKMIRAVIEILVSLSQCLQDLFTSTFAPANGLKWKNAELSKKV